MDAYNQFEADHNFSDVYNKPDVSMRRRLLYEGAAAEVAGMMLAFLNRTSKDGLTQSETEKLQKQIQKALWLHPQGTKEGVEEAVVYLTQVLAQVYGVPLKPMQSHIQLHKENTGPAASGDAQPPQARSPALLPQPYSIKAVKSAEPSVAHQLPANLVRPAYQDVATQTMSAQGIHAGQQGNLASMDVEPMIFHSPQQLSVGAHKRLPEGLSADVHTKPAEAPVEEHLDRYYLAAAGRNLELLTDLMAGQQITASSLPVQAGVPHSERSNRPIKAPARQQGATAQKFGSRDSRPPSQKILKESFEPTNSAKVVPRPLDATTSSQQAAVSTATRSDQQQSSSAPEHASVLHQPFPWGQGAWMEQLAAVVAAAASAASAAVQAQQAPHLLKHPPSPIHPLNAAPLQPVMGHQISPNSVDAQISGSLEQASGSTPVREQQSHDMAAAAECADTPQIAERHGIERSVQTEDASSAGQTTTDAALDQQGSAPCHLLHSKRPSEGSAAVLSEPSCERSSAHGHSQAAQVLSSSAAAQAGPTATLTQQPHIPSFAFAPSHLYGPVMEQQWPPSIHAPAEPPPLLQNHTGVHAGAVSAGFQLPASAGLFGNTSIPNLQSANTDRVEEPTSQPVFDYTKAREALQKLQQAPEPRSAAAGVRAANQAGAGHQTAQGLGAATKQGGRRVPRFPSPTPVACADLRKRTVSPARARPASTRPATPPGFAAPPAPKRQHLAFGSRAAPPQAAPAQGAPAPRPLVPRVAALSTAMSDGSRKAPRAQQKPSVSATTRGEAKHSKQAQPTEAQAAGCASTAEKREDALRALAALLLQPRTLQLLGPDQEHVSSSSSSSEDGAVQVSRRNSPAAVNAPAHTERSSRHATELLMADKATQYTPNGKQSGMPEGDLAHPHTGSVEQQPEQLRPVMLDRQVQSDLDVSEAAQLVALRANLVEHIADAVAARLRDHQAPGQPAAEAAGGALQGTEQTTQPEAMGGADATCTIQVLSSHGGYGGSAASAIKIRQNQSTSKVRVARQTSDQVASQKSDAPSDTAELGDEGDVHHEEDLERGSGAEQAAVAQPAAGEEGSGGEGGAWWEHWRGRLSQEEMQQAAQEVVAEELAQLLEAWDGAPGSLPSTLHGLAAQRASPPPPPTAAAAPSAAPLHAHDAREPLAAPTDTTALAQQQDGRDASEAQVDQPGMREGGEGEEIVRAVQQRVQELCLQQQQQAAAAQVEAQSDALLHAVLEALAEVSLEQLRARPPPSSPQRAACRHVPTCAGRHLRRPAGDATRLRPAPTEDAAFQQELPRVHAGAVQPPWDGAGLWVPERAQYEQPGSNLTKATRGGRAKRSLERLKRRRQTAQRNNAAPDTQREAAVQAADLASSLDGSANPRMHPEQHFACSSEGEAMEANVRRDGRAPPPREGESLGERYVFGGSAGRSRPASPDLREHHRSQAWSEDDDAGDIHASHLRLLHRPQPPGGPQLHSSLPEHCAARNDIRDRDGDRRWDVFHPPRVPSPAVQPMTRQELYAARRRHLVAEAGLTDPVLFSSTSTFASTSLSETSSLLTSRRSFAALVDALSSSSNQLSTPCSPELASGDPEQSATQDSSSMTEPSCASGTSGVTDSSLESSISTLLSKSATSSCLAGSSAVSSEVSSASEGAGSAGQGSMYEHLQQRMSMLQVSL
ncbi:hypothetical protein COCOBI_10-2490 [Coccomyxa sp. Obi]|nr:hypothetical protein COCOBI_10-2490 [Coccomyxa sp. Obi]